MPQTTADRSDRPTPIAVKTANACRMLDCGPTQLYKLMNQGRLQSFKDGKHRKILVASIMAYVAGQQMHNGGKIGEKVGSAA
jgi:Helix-turn-helix domain